MLRIHPFAAVRPQPHLAARVAAVPYDVVSADEARALVEGNPVSFLHVSRPEVDLPPETPPYDATVYETGRLNLERLVESGAMFDDPEPRLYVYRQVMDHRTQVGLVCCCHIDDYANGLIKRHEKTRQVKEDDRTRHLLTLDANSGPVFLTYRDRDDIDRLIADGMNQRPIYHFDAPDGVTHTVWSIDDGAPIVDAFTRVPCAYVADGHHRAASAARAGAELRAQAGSTEDPEHEWFLTVLFPASQLHILGYHRLVLDLGDANTDDVIERLKTLGRWTSATTPEPTAKGSFCFFFGDAAPGWWTLEIDPASIPAEDPIRSLDVSILQDRVLSPLFGIDDPRVDPRLDFVGGIRGPGALEAAVREGRAAIAITMHPTSINELLEVADADEVMPPKSTWFEPKLRSGLFVHRLHSEVTTS